MNDQAQHLEHISKHAVRRFCPECMEMLTPAERAAFDRARAYAPGLVAVTREFLREAAWPAAERKSV